MNSARKKVVMTEFKKRICELDAESIAYYRRNPVLACLDLLGIRLIDSQKYILQMSWNTPHCVWCCSRNFGKSFLGAIFIILKAVLYENQNIYIVSSVGTQSKETFAKIEEIILGIGKTAASIKNLSDILSKETKKNSSNKTGFSHAPEGYSVEFYNGSAIYTLNSSPDNNRSKRASLVFFDEAAFCSDELIAVCEAFATQNSDFITSTDNDYNYEVEALKVPTQLVYASSQDDMSKMFYKHYKDFAKKMFAGDRNYFVCDMTCDTAITTYMEGKPYLPLLTQAKVDAAVKADPDKAAREYYNKPSLDGGVSQIIKWSTIRRNEKFYLPTLNWKPNGKYVFAFDPARTMDNSILGIMNLFEDDEMGLCGDVVNIVSFIDEASKKKYKLDSNQQLQGIRETLLKYNSNFPDYEYIDSLLIDQGAGGGGTSTYADQLMNDWVDNYGKTHRGLIDANHELYTDLVRQHPNAIDKVKLISPRKYRTQMVEEFIELMNLGVLRFPFEYNGKDFINIAKTTNGEEILEPYDLSDDEKRALIQIDLMKKEITSIQKTENAEKTSISYALAKEVEHKIHDDRFYVAILLAHRLYELRRGTIINTPTRNRTDSPLVMFRQPQLINKR